MGGRTAFALILGIGVMVHFFTNMDYLNPAGAWPEKEAIRIAPEHSLRAPAAAITKDSNSNTDLWSCSCVQRAASDCSKGYVFKTMHDAADYSRHECGDECATVCTVQHHGEAPRPFTADAKVAGEDR